MARAFGSWIFILISLESASILAGTKSISTKGLCKKWVEQFSNGSEEGPTEIQKLIVPPSLVVKGGDSKEVYVAEWSFSRSQSPDFSFRGTNLILRYRPLSGSRSSPRILAVLSDKQKEIILVLPRNNSGNFYDYELAEHSLSYILDRAHKNEVYIIYINNPEDVDALNERFEELLEKAKIGYRSRRAQSDLYKEPDDFEKTLDPFSESYFKNIRLSLLRKPFDRVFSEDAVRVFTETFKQTPVGKILAQKTRWKFKVTFEPYETLPDEDRRGFSHTGYRYKVVLKKAY